MELEFERRKNIFEKYISSDEYREKMLLRLKINDACDRSREARAYAIAACKKDPIFFIENFGWTFDPRPYNQINGDGNLPFILFDYQKEDILWIMKRIELGTDGFVEKSRDMGITWEFVYAFLYKWLFGDSFSGLMGSYKEALVDNKTGDSLFGKLDYALLNLPKFLLPHKFNFTKHRTHMKLVNPENFNLITGDTCNPLFGRGSRKSAIFYDESAFWDYFKESWDSGGDSTACRIACSCVSPETLILTQNGFIEINELRKSEQKGFSLLNEKVFGKNNFVNAKNFYDSGIQKTIKIKTDKNFELEGSIIHPIWAMKNGEEKFVMLQDLNIGDWVAIKRGMNCFGSGLDITFQQKKQRKILNFPKQMDKDLAYLIGLIISEGDFDWGKPVTKSRGRVTITNCDKEIGDFLQNGLKKYNIVFNKSKDGIHFIFSSENFIDFLRWIGFSHWKAKEKRIPLRMFQCEEEVFSEFLRGMFDGDGCVSKTRKQASYSSASEKLINELRMVLLNYGIVTSKYFRKSSPAKRVKKYCDIWNLEINGKEAVSFLDRINFRLERKRIKKNQAKSYIEKKVNDNFLWVKIKNIDYGKKEVVDLHIPNKHQFFSNGFLSHNTPAGRNASALLREQQFGYIDVKTIHWRLHPLKDEQWYEYEKSRRDDETIAQELDISYNKSTSGRVYPEWSDVNYGYFPYKDDLPLFVSWDLGATDYTALIWWQRDGDKFFIVDAYEKNKEIIDFFVPFVTGIIPRGEWHSRYSKKDLEVINSHIGWKKAIHIAGSDADFIQQTSNKSIKDILKNYNINIQIDNRSKEFQGRKTSAKMIMRKLFVNDNERTKYLGMCMENAHYPKIVRGGSDEYRTNKPVHDWTEAYRSAFEYMAFHFMNRKSNIITGNNVKKNLDDDEDFFYPKAFKKELLLSRIEKKSNQLIRY